MGRDQIKWFCIGLSHHCMYFWSPAPMAPGDKLFSQRFYSLLFLEENV